MSETNEGASAQPIEEQINEPVTPAAKTADIIPEPSPVPVAPEMVTGDDLVAEEPEPEKGEDGEPEGEQQWICPVCKDRPWKYRSHLVRHIKRRHKDQADALIGTLPVYEAKPRPTFAPPPPPVVNPPTPAGEAVDPMAAMLAAPSVDYELMSNILFDTSTGTLVMIFGEEWKPRNEDERKMMVVGISGYLKSKQVKDIPPGLMLTLLVTAYAAPRLREPSTAQKLQTGWIWLKGKLSGIFKRKSAP